MDGSSLTEAGGVVGAPARGGTRYANRSMISSGVSGFSRPSGMAETRAGSIASTWSLRTISFWPVESRIVQLSPSTPAATMPVKVRPSVVVTTRAAYWSEMTRDGFRMLSTISCLTYALFADRVRKTIRKHVVRRTVNRSGGTVLIAAKAVTAGYRKIAA